MRSQLRRHSSRRSPDRRDEHRQDPTFEDQGRTPGHRRLSRQSRNADRVRHSGRRSRSGCQRPDRSIALDALHVIERYGMAFPEHIIRYLQEEAADVDPDHPCFRNDEVKVIASARSSLEAAAELARRRGVPAVVLSDAIEGQAREITKVHAAIEGGRAQRPAVPQAGRHPVGRRKYGYASRRRRRRTKHRVPSFARDRDRRT